jgi:uncharacterized damage-inducible protein DinB
MILPEFDNEMRTTRALLERVPENDAAWKPHPKSRSLGELAIHVAALPRFASGITATTDFDAQQQRSASFTSTSDLLQQFDTNVAQAREAIGGTSDEEYGKPWTLRSGDYKIFTLPRAAALRVLVLNHLIHHRGQLSVYLRQRDVPLPSIYGPTADLPL